MGRWGVVFLVLLALAGCRSTEPYRRAATTADKIAGDVLARQMIEGLGGFEAWERLQVISFTFKAELGVDVLSRRHHWDKKLGLHHLVEGEGGDELVVLSDLWAHDGMAWRGGTAVTDAVELKELLTQAHEAWVNDVYWLAAPFKVFDEGVHRAAVDGDLRLSFDDGVGITSGDVYLFDLDENGAPLGWSFVLESGVQASFAFEDRQVHDGVTFFGRKEAVVGAIVLDDIKTSTGARPELFQPLAARRGFRGEGA